MEKLYFFREYLTNRYGKALQRISFDLGLSCPNRKKDGSGGCAFCSGEGARARHLSENMSLKAQYERSKAYLKERYDSDGPYIAYFQAYTSTYGDLELLKKLYEEALSFDNFPVVVISTRPDCLPEEVLDYLEKMAENCELWLELGVQTSCDRTLEKINRGHDFACAKDAILRISKRKNIRCAPHVILGLPGEDREDFQRTAKELAHLPIAGIKVHNLLVLRGTPMAKMLHDGECLPMNEITYAGHLRAFLKELPEKTVLMRLSAEDDPEKIIAPSWWMSKGAFLEMFRNFYTDGDEKENAHFQAVKTLDGSYTYYHPQYKQYFHSIAGAFSESWKKYLEVCSIPELCEKGEEVRILEVGFGLGCNASALATLCENGKNSIFLHSLELDERVLESAIALPGHPQKEMLTTLKEKKEYQKGRFRVKLSITDARKFLEEELLEKESPLPSVHFIFLDGFSPESNPELWSIDFVFALKKLLLPGGIIASYCHAYPLIGAFLKEGFTLYESNPYGRKKGGLAAVNGELRKDCSYPLLTPLPSKEEKIALLSTAGIPYEDPGLSNTRETILMNRKLLVEEKRKEGMPKWYKEK